MGGMELYELTLVVNRLQEKAIRDVFDQHRWQFIIAGVKCCAIPRLPRPHRFPSDSGDVPEHDLTKGSDVENEATEVNRGQELSLVSMEVKKSSNDECVDSDDVADLPNSPVSAGYGPAQCEDDDSDADFHVQMKKVRYGHSGEEKNVKQNRESRHGRIKRSQGRPKQEIWSTTSVPNSVTKDTTEKAGSTIPEKFQCGNCSESFQTFQGFRLHLAMHKLTNSEISKSGSTVGKVGPRRKGMPKKFRASKQFSSLNRKVQRPCKLAGLTSDEEEKKSLSTTDMPMSDRAEIDSGNSQDFSCRFCTEEFITFRELRLHLQEHKESADIPLSSTTKRKSDTPVRKVSAQSRVCEICGKSFPNAAALRVHDRVHTGERPYLCNQCGKAFKQVSAFQSHLRTHTGETPFKCTMCEAAFRQLGELHRHLRRHTGEKPQLCTICGKRFAERGYLKSHMRLHTGEKPFSCALCEKSFSQRTSLKCHMKSHHKNNPENSALQPPLTPNRERTRDSHQTHTSSNEKDECEIQPNTSPCTGGDTRTNGHRKSTKDLTEGSYHTDLVLPHHDHTTPIVSPAYTQSTHTENYGSDNSALQLPHTQFIQMDPGSNNQPLPSLHGDRYMSGFFQNT